MLATSLAAGIAERFRNPGFRIEQLSEVVKSKVSLSNSLGTGPDSPMSHSYMQELHARLRNALAHQMEVISDRLLRHATLKMEQLQKCSKTWQSSHKQVALQQEEDFSSRLAVQKQLPAMTSGTHSGPPARSFQLPNLELIGALSFSQLRKIQHTATTLQGEGAQNIFS